MRISVYSSKGGAGKTPIATNIALDRGYIIGTNEKFHSFDSMNAFDEDQFLYVDMEDKFPDFREIGPDLDLIFDLAGSISKSSFSISSAINQSDLVIVPIENEQRSITNGVNTILEIQALNIPVLVVVTKLEKGKKELFTDWVDSVEFKRVKAEIDHHIKSKVKVLPLKLSKIFRTIFEAELSITQIMEIDPLARYQQKIVAQQFAEIYSFIDSLKTHEHTSQKEAELA